MCPVSPFSAMSSEMRLASVSSIVTLACAGATSGNRPRLLLRTRSGGARGYPSALFPRKQDVRKVTSGRAAAPALALIIGARLMCTASMISPLSIPGGRWPTGSPPERSRGPIRQARALLRLAAPHAGGQRSVRAALWRRRYRRVAPRPQLTTRSGGSPRFQAHDRGLPLLVQSGSRPHPRHVSGVALYLTVAAAMILVPLGLVLGSTEVQGQRPTDVHGTDSDCPLNAR